jgi:flagella basal body P-ring formation protein FlgA
VTNALLTAISTVIFSLVLAPSAQAADGAPGVGVETVIQVKSVVEVDGTKPEIFLGDLVVAHGVSDNALEAIKNVRLADTPKAGESRSFTSMGLEQIFRQHLRDHEAQSGEKISLRIPTRVTVVRKSFKLLPEEVQAELKSQMKEFCADCSFEISNFQLPTLSTTVSNGSSWAVKLRHEMPKGSFSLPVEVTNEDASKRVYWITGSVAISKKVPVAARAMQAGERLQPQDFTMQTKDITFSTDTAASEAELSSTVAARQISAGQIVWRSLLRREMAVKNGDIVKVIAGDASGNGGWQVMIDGVAQGSGYIGDLINVKIPRTQKLLSGLLTEKGIVEVR